MQYTLLLIILEVINSPTSTGLEPASPSVVLSLQFVTQRAAGGTGVQPVSVMAHREGGTSAYMGAGGRDFSLHGFQRRQWEREGGTSGTLISVSVKRLCESCFDKSFVKSPYLLSLCFFVSWHHYYYYSPRSGDWISGQDTVFIGRRRKRPEVALR